MGTTEVRLRRGRYSTHFQVTRAMLSAASALAYSDQDEAMKFLTFASAEIEMLRGQLKQDRRKANELR